MAERHTPMVLRGSSRPHLRAVKPSYVHPNRRKPGGSPVPGADPVVEAGARCAGTDTDHFFADHAADIRAAKEFCVSCPVREACLEVALANDELYGVFGGMSAKERRKLARERRAAA